ncbi:MAG: hypothetical protein MI919_40875, partial [Holophagales bacterium]|nr:hypothetical protein [Holophagales bacterium]
VLRYPEGLPAGRRVEHPVSLIDLAPTLLDLAAAEPLPGALGRSLLPLLGEPGPPPSPLEANPVARGAVAISELTSGAQDEDWLLALRAADWKLVARPDDGELEGLWDLRADPEELSNLLGKRSELEDDARRALRLALQELEEAHQRLAPEPSSSDEMSPEVRAQLESLGYLSSGRERDDGAPPIQLHPNPIVVCGDPPRFGKAEVRWRAPGHVELLEVRIGGPDGRLFAQGAPSGAQATGEWLEDGMELYLVDAGRRIVLGKATAQMTEAGCPRPVP